MAANSSGAVRACVFDAYGTLFDFASAGRRCRDVLGDSLDKLTTLWREMQLQYTWLRAAQGRLSGDDARRIRSAIPQFASVAHPCDTGAAVPLTSDRSTPTAARSPGASATRLVPHVTRFHNAQGSRPSGQKDAPATLNRTGHSGHDDCAQKRRDQ
jgi:hypothetical protein